MKKVFRETREIKNSLHFKSSERIDFPAHIHEEIELVFVKKGESSAFCNGEEYKIGDNTFFMAFPNQIHHYENSIKGKYIVLKIHPSRLLSFSNVFLEGEPISAVYRFCEGDDDNAVFLLETALYEFKRDGYNTVIDAYLTVLFGKLLKHYKIEKSKASRSTVLSILEYCSEHYRETITVAQVAEDLQISRSTVSHIFSKRLRMNFCDYINSLRLTDAEMLLGNGSYSITEVANMSGFSDIRTFNRAFLKRFGVSPSAYKKTKLT